jgi:hypothetical protein
MSDVADPEDFCALLGRQMAIGKKIPGECRGERRPISTSCLGRLRTIRQIYRSRSLAGPQRNESRPRVLCATEVRLKC